MKNAFTIVFALLFSIVILAQSKKAEKAKEYLKEGMMASSAMDEESAIKYYKKAVKTDPTYNTGWLMLARSLSKTGTEFNLRKTAYKAILITDSTTKTGLSAYSGLRGLYQFEGTFDSVAIYYQKIMSHSQLSDKQKAKMVKDKKSVEYAAAAYKKPLRFDPYLMNSSINNPDALQYFPILTGDENRMIFTRRFKGSQNEDIYIARRTGSWHEAEKLEGAINGPEGEGTATITADGNTLICSYCGDGRENMGNCDLYYSTLENGSWSKLKNLGKMVNTKHYEAQPTLSSDGRVLLFISDRPNGIGGLDIYSCIKDENGNWSTPKNLGATINTKENEGSPFLHASGQTLFFASKGHIGFGGYDLYATDIEDGKWQTPRNLGYPINDQMNQLSMCVSPDGKTGYFSKEEYDASSIMANQSNIWSFQVPPELKLGHRSNYITGNVYDNITKQPVSATMKLINLEDAQTKTMVVSRPSDGKYMVMLAEGSDYAFYAETRGYLFKSISFVYKEMDNIKPITMDIYLDPIIKGVTVQLNNIYFETGKWTLLTKSKVELNKLYQLMKTNPGLKIELGGHTDNVGSDDSNNKLSLNRVNSVKKYLKSKGISASRMVSKGYGASKPIADNSTDEGRKENRRVEFTVLNVK
jgi:OOP family OmpA-OmpF porin